MGTVVDLPVAVSIFTEYGDSDCCVSGVMGHSSFPIEKSAEKLLVLSGTKVAGKTLAF
jgi:hypothetical protein